MTDGSCKQASAPLPINVVTAPNDMLAGGGWAACSSRRATQSADGRCLRYVPRALKHNELGGTGIRVSELCLGMPTLQLTSRCCMLKLQYNWESLSPQNA